MPGVEEFPCQMEVNQMGQKSLTALNNLLNSGLTPGDSVFLRRGDRWIENSGIAVNAAQGRLDQYLFVGAYGTGSKPRIEKSGAGEILLCRGSANAATSFITFQNLDLLSNSPIGSRPIGVYINESFYNLKPHHIILDGLKIQGCQSGMILYQNNIIVENCLLEKMATTTRDKEFSAQLRMFNLKAMYWTAMAVAVCLYTASTSANPKIFCSKAMKLKMRMMD